MTVAFTVYGHAAPAGSKTTGQRADGSRYVRDSGEARKRLPKTSQWKAMVTQAAAEAMRGHPLFTGPVRLELVFWLPRPKHHYGTGRNAGTVKESAPLYHTVMPDVTKLVRSTEDAMKGIVWTDDQIVAKLAATKLYGAPVRCEVKVGPVVPPGLEDLDRLMREPAKLLAGVAGTSEGGSDGDHGN